MSNNSGLGIIDIALAVALGILIASDDGAFDKGNSAENSAPAQQVTPTPKPPAP